MGVEGIKVFYTRHLNKTKGAYIHSVLCTLNTIKSSKIRSFFMFYWVYITNPFYTPASS